MNDDDFYYRMMHWGGAAVFGRGKEAVDQQQYSQESTLCAHFTPGAALQKAMGWNGFFQSSVRHEVCT